MRREAGFAMANVIISVAVAGVTAAVAVAVAVPQLARERLRGATYEMQSALQLSRAEAVARSRPARLVFDAEARTLETWDTKGTASTSDDELIRRKSLPDSVSLARPDQGDAVTFDEKSSNKFEVVFAANGSVQGNAGEVALHGGGNYTLVTLQAAGSASVRKWDDGTWKSPDGRVETTVSSEQWEAARTGTAGNGSGTTGGSTSGTSTGTHGTPTR